MSPRLRRWHVRDVVIALVGVLGVAMVLRGTVLPPGGTQPRTVTIRRGSGVNDIARTLYRAGVIHSPLLFVATARGLHMDRSLRAGQYELAPNLNVFDVLHRLQKGSDFRVTVPEGLTAAEVADTLHTAIGLDRGEFLMAVRDSALRRELGVATPTLEGYLFPESYKILPDMSAREIVAQMVQQFARVYSEEFGDARPPQGLTRQQAITLASIVEAEAHVAEERPRIAAVYLNRLRLGMRLQADPTVAYALGGRRRERIYYKDLEVDSPYNTYRRAGLPPGPIANPGLAAIRAVFHPATPCDDLFFVATGDGRHVFTTTLAAHDAAIRQVRGGGANGATTHAPATGGGE